MCRILYSGCIEGWMVSWLYGDEIYILYIFILSEKRIRFSGLIIFSFVFEEHEPVI